MKKFLRILKWTGIILGSCILLLVLYILIFWNKTYDRPYPDIHASTDSSVIARGKYIVFGPGHCADCHAMQRIKDVEAGMEVPLTGGFVFNIPPGKVVVKNITPDKETGIGNYTDGELARVLRYSVDKEGHAIPGFMECMDLSNEDLTAIISYLRSRPAVKTNNPKTSWNFLGKFVYAFGMIHPSEPSATPPNSVSPDTTAAYGKYLTIAVATCRSCHTNRSLQTGAFIGPEYAGGFHMEDDKNPGTFYVSRNITPDPKTGWIYHWTETQFIERFHLGRVLPNSPMPWAGFKQFSDNDLRAIWNYLHTIKPVEQDNGEPLQKQ